MWVCGKSTIGGSGVTSGSMRLDHASDPGFEDNDWHRNITTEGAAPQAAQSAALLDFHRPRNSRRPAESCLRLLWFSSKHLTSIDRSAPMRH